MTDEALRIAFEELMQNNTQLEEFIPPSTAAEYHRLLRIAKAAHPEIESRRWPPELGDTDKFQRMNDGLDALIHWILPRPQQDPE
jgi:hypothetical protein